jgi:epsin
MTTKAVLRSIKNVTNGYSSAQILVRECTSNDPSSPTISKMAEVADLTYKNGSFQDVMDIIDKRLNDKGKNWRHVAKALTLLDYLVRYGSDDVVIWAKDNLYIIKTLREFNVADSAGHDQGSIIRVKAKELSSLLQDDERLREEREAAQQSNSRGRRRNRNRNRPSRYDSEDEIYDEDLQRALEESKQTAEEEEYKRKTQTDESLERAIQLSLEEEEMRKKNQNLLDLNDDTNPPDVYGFYQQQQQQQQNQGQIIGYDMFGNPVYGNQPMATGYLQNAYQDLADQQLAQQQALYLQQQQQQQQLLYQQQLAAANQQMSMPTGSNNPFAMQQQQQQQQLLYQQEQQELQLQQHAEEEARRKEEELKKQQQLLEEQQKILLEQQRKVQLLQQLQIQQAQSPVKPTLTGSQKMSQQYSELNDLLAQGTGLDTFGNTGEARIPAQFTKTGTFINSQGTGYKQMTSSNNPFLDTQFTGMISSNTAARIVPAETGYGFGNQQQLAQQQRQRNPNNLIDL